MIRRPPRSTLFPTRRSSDLRPAGPEARVRAGRVDCPQFEPQRRARPEEEAVAQGAVDGVVREAIRRGFFAEEARGGPRGVKGGERPAGGGSPPGPPRRGASAPPA